MQAEGGNGKCKAWYLGEEQDWWAAAGNGKHKGKTQGKVTSDNVHVVF